MYRILIFLGITLSTLLSFSSHSFAASVDNIVGTYNCHYNDPTLKSPEGDDVIDIKKTSDNFFKVTHTMKESTTPYVYGVGLFNKNIDNAFAYVYWYPKSPKYSYIEYFIINSDNTLSGVFTESNKKFAGTETCKKAT